MNKINVFYHIYLVNDYNYESIINDQLEKLLNLKNKNNKIKFYINITNSDSNIILSDNLIRLMEELGSHVTHTSNNLFELSTLSMLYNHALNTVDEYYLYIHTKGITRLSHLDDGKYSYKNVENWRHIMEHFCIEQYETCVDELKNYDLVGCNYIPSGTMGVPAHYSGNFWWSKSEFIKKLPNIGDKLKSHIDRFDAEFWVGSICHKALCLFPIPKPIYENHNRCYSYNEKQEYYNNIIKSEFTNCG